ncbi:hypothetical protein GCM10023156_12490 [Novipirellula rosea]|uniref:Uncharacterized protein n=1 Tax=Novipirellula rosea TaxID=1031540 RepID=A0ABP8MFZ8_9BACT
MPPPLNKIGEKFNELPLTSVVASPATNVARMIELANGLLLTASTIDFAGTLEMLAPLRGRSTKMAFAIGWPVESVGCVTRTAVSPAARSV